MTMNSPFRTFVCWFFGGKNWGKSSKEKKKSLFLTLVTFRDNFLMGYPTASILHLLHPSHISGESCCCFLFLGFGHLRHLGMVIWWFSGWFRWCFHQVCDQFWDEKLYNFYEIIWRCSISYEIRILIQAPTEYLHSFTGFCCHWAIAIPPGVQALHMFSNMQNFRMVPWCVVIRAV